MNSSYSWGTEVNGTPHGRPIDFPRVDVGDAKESRLIRAVDPGMHAFGNVFGVGPLNVAKVVSNKKAEVNKKDKESFNGSNFETRLLLIDGLSSDKLVFTVKLGELSITSYGSSKLNETLNAYLDEVKGVAEYNDGKVIHYARWLLELLGNIVKLEIVPTPQAALSEENSLAFTWQTKNNQIGLYVYSDGKFDWLWRDRVTKQFDGKEGIQSGLSLPTGFVAKFKTMLLDS